MIEFDKFLSESGLGFEAIVIGGAALNILDISSRKTKDVDCLDPKIPGEIKKASQEFTKKKPNLALDIDWLNNGPETLKTDLPDGWRKRVKPLFNGSVINLKVLDRADFLKSKLFAYCDRTTPDFEDLINLKPSSNELSESIAWVKERDAHAKWSEHVEISFKVLRKALGYE